MLTNLLWDNYSYQNSYKYNHKVNHYVMLDLEELKVWRGREMLYKHLTEELLINKQLQIHQMNEYQ